MKTATYTKALTIALHPDPYEQIRQITDERKISIAEWIRNAVDSALEKHLPKEDL